MTSIHHNQLTLRPVNQEAVADLMANGYALLYAQLLAQRGIQGSHEIKTNLGELHHWSHLKGIHEAATGLMEAILNKHKIIVVADYDADGATACAVALRALRQFGALVDYVVPNRLTMGYGLTPDIVNLALDKKAKILVTVDNGIASIEGVEHANRHGLKVIVTDHHLPSDKLPSAYAIVNPNQPGCQFPSKSLAGVGVIFYVMLALRSQLKEHGVITPSSQPNLANLLDLVALGTIADLVALDSNNRLLVEEGLKRIRQGVMQPGLRALYEITGKDYHKAQSNDLGFALGPRINAAGRMDDMTLGIECLVTSNLEQARVLAEQLNQFNQERKQVEEGMQQAALEQFNATLLPNQYTLTLFDENWHPGVVGLVASRLKERYHRPVIAFAKNTDNETIRGSGRSIPGFHLRDALDLVSKQCPDVIQRFGGHAGAAGLTIKKTKFQDFLNGFESVAQQLLNKDTLTHRIYYDASLEAKDITSELAQWCEQKVWGQAFPAPLFLGKFKLIQQRLVGEKHSRLILENGEHQFNGIYFNWSDSLPEFLTLLFRIGINEWNGQSQLQLEISHWCDV